MFRHQGKSRTVKHNIRIAILLSFVAGIVNVVGFLKYGQLTTNVTGHFAYFMNDLAHSRMVEGLVYFLYILSFFLGSICSALLIEMLQRNKKFNVFIVPVMVESLVLSLIPLLEYYWKTKNPGYLICLMLFAMGLQNSFVTRISNAVVRTTHLTGLFTDLGIDIVQLFSKKESKESTFLKSNIKLRLSIIFSFFIGGLTSGYLYSEMRLGLNSMYIGVALLIIGLFYDDFRYRIIKAKRGTR